MIYAEHVLICISIPLLITLLFLRASVRQFAASFTLGMFLCLLAAYISGFLNSALRMDVESTAVFLSPIVEECMKLIPLAFYLILFSPADSVLCLAALGIGAGFATFENCYYLLNVGVLSFAHIIIRGFAVGVMHVVCALSLVLGLILVRRFRAMSLAGVLGALSMSTLFHGLYNLLVSQSGIPSIIGFAMPIAVAFMLIPPYRKLLP